MITQVREQVTYFVSRNKRVKFWHRRFGHISNVWVVRALRLLIGMGNLSNMKYNPTDVYSNSKESESDISHNEYDLDTKDLTKNDEPTDNPTSISSICMIKDSNLNSLYLPYITSKQMQVVIRNMPMTKADDKLNKVYIDLWKPYYPASVGGKTYATFFLNKKTQKTNVIYL